MMNNICISAPQFQDKDITGVPFYALFFDFLDTRFGMAFFGSTIVNTHLKNIFNAYSIMLQSDVSRKYMNKKEPYGWFSPAAVDEKRVNYADYYADTKLEDYGYKTWHDWFTRAIRPEARPIDTNPKVIVNSSDSYPVIYPG